MSSHNHSRKKVMQKTNKWTNKKFFKLNSKQEKQAPDSLFIKNKLIYLMKIELIWT